MPLDPQVEALVAPMADAPPIDFDTIDPAIIRGMFTTIGPPGTEQPVARVENRSVPGPAGEIPVRVYTPDGEGPFPLVVFFHGGGFVLCDLDSHDGLCRAITNGVGCVVVSVDYRLAPEDPYPAGPEDCYAATCYVADHAGEFGGDPGRVALAGDSAGGNLSAVVALMVRERGGPRLAHQALIYPVIDHACDTPSYDTNAEAPVLSKAMMRWFWRHYLADPSHGDQPFASPNRESDLSGLPPATVITAEYDPLRDEGRAYAEALIAAGVPTEHLDYDGMIHGFVSMFDHLDGGKHAVGEICARLRKAFGV